MIALALAMHMHHLLPVAGTGAAWEAQWRYRLELAGAIAAATNDPGRQLLLVRIARFESNYREDVGRCRLNGKAGDRSAFQVVPRNDGERARLCVSLVEDARLALERVEESLAACRHLPAPERLAVYARGRCDSEQGRALSRHRWPGARQVEDLTTWINQGDAHGTAGQREAAE